MKLYELTENYNNLLELLDREDIDPQIIKDALDSVGDDIDTKADNIVRLIKSLKAEEEALKNEIANLTARKQTTTKKTDRLKQYLTEQMALVGRDKIGKLHQARLQNNPPSVFVEDEKSILPDYWVQQAPQLDKQTILKLLKAGQEVVGAKMMQGQSLRVK